MKKNIVLYISLFSILFSSCTTDVDVNEEWEDVTVVYGLLNQNDSVHYIRINKAFLGEADAYSMAHVSDSIHYGDDIEVMLEAWKDGQLKETITLELTEIEKDTGVFASDNNIVFYTTRQLFVENEYKLKVLIPGKEAVTSTTTLLNGFKVDVPNSFRPKYISFANYNNSFSVEWRTAENAKLYELNLRFHYLEIENGDTVFKSLEWYQPSNLSTSLGGGESMFQEIPNKSFFNQLINLIPEKEGVRRLAHRGALDFLFMIGDEDLNTYIEVSRPSEGIVQEKPAFTNIENGIGIFASVFDASVLGKPLSKSTLDSLSMGIYTKQLNFVGKDDPYYSVIPVIGQ